MSRIFSIRVNLDELSSQLDTLISDAEMAQWLRGFMAGSRGAVGRFPVDSPGSMGHQTGSMAHSQAVHFQQMQSIKGSASAALRKVKGQPRFNHGSTAVPTEGQPRFQPEGNQSSNRVIEESNDRENEKTSNPISTLAVAPELPPVKPARKKPEAIGPEIPTSNGPWRLTIGAARKRMTAYGMTEAQMIDILGRIAKRYVGLPSDKLPGAAGMSSILDKWLIKHGPGCAATETGPRGSTIAAENLDYIIALQNELHPRASA